MTGIIDLAGGGYHNLKVKKKKMKNARSTQMRISSLLATLGYKTILFIYLEYLT